MYPALKFVRSGLGVAMGIGTEKELPLGSLFETETLGVAGKWPWSKLGHGAVGEPLGISAAKHCRDECGGTAKTESMELFTVTF